MKTFLKRPGNKSKVLRHILPHLPTQYNTYYEPFVGTGALFLKLEPKKWVINDLNKDIYKIWKYVQKDPQPFIDFFQDFDSKVKNYTHEQKLEYCKDLTESLNHLPYNLYRTVLYLLLINIVYGGSLITNNKYYFSGLYVTGSYDFRTKQKLSLTNNIYTKNLMTISKFLKNGKIYNQDYKKILDQTVKDDFVYLDPPYFEEKKYQFNYNRGERVDSNFIDDLFSECKKMDKKGVKWMMSQVDTLEIREKFKEYKIVKYKIYRFFLKDYKSELLIKNYH